MKTTPLLWIASLSLLVLPSHLFADTIHVPGDNTSVQAGLNAAATGDTVLLAPGTYTEFLDWPAVNGIVLTSSGTSDNTVLDANAYGSVITFPDGDIIDSSTVISKVTITRGRSLFGGGAMCLEASPTFDDVKFVDNESIEDGGGLYYVSTEGNVYLSNVTFSGNTAGGSGGGLMIFEANTHLADASFTNNTAMAGGGMFISNCDFDASKLTLAQNHASQNGGAATVANATVLLSNATIRESGSPVGGGLYSYISSLTITDSEIADNSADNGGGIKVLQGELTMSDAVVAENLAAEGGGGIHLEACSNPVLSHVVIRDNLAGDGGGGLMAIDNSTPTFEYVTFFNNTSLEGGGLYLLDGACTMNECEFAGNSASMLGGGIYLKLGALSTFSQVDMIGNSALYGGAVFSNGVAVAWNAMTFFENSAVISGGAILDWESDSVLVTNSQFISNRASDQGSAVYMESGNRFRIDRSIIIGDTSQPVNYPVVVTGAPTLVSIANCNFDNPGGVALYNEDLSPVVDADSCWWGDDSGPYHGTDNPSGVGDSVSVSVNVLPWLTSPSVDAPPMPVTGLTKVDSSGSTISLEWDMSLLADATSYTVCWGTSDTRFTYSDSTTGIPTPGYVIEGLNPDTEYRVSVKVEELGGVESFYCAEMITSTGSNVSPAAFVLTEPPNEAIIDADLGFPLTFSWTEAIEQDYKDTVRYQLEVYTDHEMTSLYSTFDADTSLNFDVMSLPVDEYWWRVMARDLCGATTFSTFTRKFTVNQSSAVPEFTGLPTEYSIRALYPNPFNPVMNVVVGLPEAAPLQVTIFNLMGQQVAELTNGQRQAGFTKLTFDGAHLASGTYFVHATVPGKMRQISKVVLMK